jgi:hypothetical protein
MAQKSRSRAAFEIAAVVAIVLAGAWFVFRHTLYKPPPPPPPPVVVEQAPAPVAPVAAPAPPPVEDALVSEVSGDAKRVDSSGGATALSVGDRLHVSDSLRTGKGARIGLEIGAGSKLTVGEGTQLTVREITNQVHRLKLTRGRITADYAKGGERSLLIENESGDTVAVTKNARFSVLANGTSLSVATAEGAVDLTAQQTTVTVGAGQQAVAFAGEAPSAAEAIPAALLLKVADASASKRVEGLCADVDGKTAPGTEVLIDGAPQAIDREGHFRVKVPRDPKDKRSVLVATRDASGLRTTREVPCGTDPEIDDMAIRWKRRRAAP